MPYGFRVEVWGDYACFSRPELKVERVSYEIITPCAARGLLEAIFWKPAIRYVVDQINVCSPIRFDNIRRNELSSKIPYSSPKAAVDKLQKGTLNLSASADRTQRAAMVLRNVRYVISFHFEMTEKAGSEDSVEKFAAIINRRLERGQCFHAPYLGTREFPANFRFIPNAEEAPAPIDEDRIFGPMLYGIDYVKKIDKKGQEMVTAFEPMYFIAEMRGGIVDLREVEILR